jgi:hypothetical protein
VKTAALHQHAARKACPKCSSVVLAELPAAGLMVTRQAAGAQSLRRQGAALAKNSSGVAASAPLHVVAGADPCPSSDIARQSRGYPRRPQSPFYVKVLQPKCA